MHSIHILERFYAFENNICYNYDVQLPALSGRALNTVLCTMVHDTLMVYDTLWFMVHCTMVYDSLWRYSDVTVMIIMKQNITVFDIIMT